MRHFEVRCACNKHNTPDTIIISIRALPFGKTVGVLLDEKSLTLRLIKATMKHVSHPFPA